MDNSRIPKQIFYGHGTRSQGGQLKRYKDALKANLKNCNITDADLEQRASDRTGWRAACRQAVQSFEANRIAQLKEKRQQRKAQSHGQIASCAVLRSVLWVKNWAICSPEDTSLVTKSVVSTVQSMSPHHLNDGDTGP